MGKHIIHRKAEEHLCQPNVRVLMVAQVRLDLVTACLDNHTQPIFYDVSFVLAQAHFSAIRLLCSQGRILQTHTCC